MSPRDGEHDTHPAAAETVGAGLGALCREVVEALDEPIHVVDPDQRILLCNRSFRRWLESLGLTGNIVGQTVAEAFPFLPEGVFAEYRSVFATGRSLTTEELTRPLGRPVHTQTQKLPIATGVGITHVVTILRDVTVQRQAEAKALAEGELRRAIERSTVAAVTALDLVGKTTYVNRAFCELTGWPEEELLGETAPFSYWPPEKVEQLALVLQDVLAGKPLEPGVELRFMRRSGERFDVLTRVAPTHDSEGEVSGWVGCFVDITDRKRAERAMWLKELALDSTSDAIVLTDLGGKIVFANRALLELLHLASPAPLLTHGVRELFAAEEAAAEAWSTLRETGACAARLTLRGAEGRPRQVQIEASTVRDACGHPLGSVVTIRP